MCKKWRIFEHSCTPLALIFKTLFYNYPESQGSKHINNKLNIITRIYDFRLYIITYL
jgi:hypothetical protein